MEKKLRSPKLTRIEKLTRGLLKGNNADMFAIKEVAGKGRGVFLKASLIRKDSFVLEYEGDIISEAEAVKREHVYETIGEGCYILYFKFKVAKMALDATKRYDSFTRLLNHSRKPNIRFHHPIVMDFNSGFPRIAAYALCDIHLGQEIVFDYGVQDGDIWLKNSEAGFVSDVDSDSSFDDSDAKENLQVYYGDSYAKDLGIQVQRSGKLGRKVQRRENVQQLGWKTENNKVYSCSQCNIAFSELWYLQNHLKTKHKDKYWKVNCSKMFGNVLPNERARVDTESSNLKTHKIIHIGEKLHKCDICSACFTQSSSLKTHKRIHTGEMPYKCDICSAGFTQSGHLKTHKRIHTGEKPYKCGICSACFTQSSSLKTHKRIHTGENPYKCDICSACFTNCSDLKKHKRIHTGEKPYKCDICSACFTQCGNLKRHKRIHTGEKP